MVFILNTDVNRRFMFLREYLQKEGITYREFAEKLGIHIHSLKNIAYGVRRPGLGLSLKIEDATNGKVTSRELFQDFDKISQARVGVKGKPTKKKSNPKPC